MVLGPEILVDTLYLARFVVAMGEVTISSCLYNPSPVRR